MARAAEATFRQERQARESAERREEDLRRFVQRVADATPHVLYLFDLVAKQVLFVNQQIERIVGVDAEELRSRGAELLGDFIHPDDVSQAGDLSARFAQTERDGVLEIDLRVADGRGGWRWLHSRNVVFSRDAGGRPIQILGTAEDVTDAYRSREGLLFLQRAIDSVTDGIALVDGRGELIYANPSFRQTYLGDRPDFHPVELFAKPEVGEEVLARVAGGSAWGGETDVRRSNGEVAPALVRASPVVGRARGQGAVVVCTDIAERQRLEDRARQREAELAHVLRISTLGELTTGLAHELNQPLSGIVSYARGCARRIARGDDPGSFLDILEHIASEALRAGEIVRRLRGLIRREKPRREEIELNALLRDAVRVVGPEIRRRQARLHLRFELPPAVVRVDRVQIEQVVVNLVGNALDSMQGVPAEKRLLTIETAWAAGDQVMVIVSDTGPGLNGQGDRVFEPFFTTKEAGLGMGLAISRTIVEAHEGVLSVDDEAPAGAKFRMTLPGRVGTKVGAP